MRPEQNDDEQESPSPPEDSHHGIPAHIGDAVIGADHARYRRNVLPAGGSGGITAETDPCLDFATRDLGLQATNSFTAHGPSVYCHSDREWVDTDATG